MFQVFSMIVWLADAYYYYAAAIGGLSIIGIVTTLVETRRVRGHGEISPRSHPSRGRT